jgi:hypothetical protein
MSRPLEVFLPAGKTATLPSGEVIDSSVPILVEGSAGRSYRGSTPAGGPDPDEWSADVDRVWTYDEDDNEVDLPLDFLEDLTTSALIDREVYA